MTGDALAVSGLSAGYGGREVLSSVDLVLRDGEVLCLAGHNGAGKSTLLKVLFGLHRPSSGERLLRGAPIQLGPAALARAGVAYLPEGRGVFPALTVAENLGLGLWSAGLTGAAARERLDEVEAILPALATFRSKRAGQLSGGQQQMVSIGRALLSRPSILLLDEPSIGLAPKLFQDLLAPILELRRRRNLSILLVEQNVDEALAVSDRAVVMKSGRVVFDGVPAELSDREKLLELF